MSKLGNNRNKPSGPDRASGFFIWFIYVPTLQKSPAIIEPETQHRYITHNCKIKPQSVVIYKRYHGFKSGKTEAELQNLEKGKNGDYNGFMSPATARKVRTMLENWLHIIEQNITDNWEIDTKTAMSNSRSYEYYPTFVTLTLPSQQNHDDNYIKRELLNRFIITLKNRYNVGHYFWRAEPQKNGNIHFHILTDKWIHWRAIRHEWNKILDDHGYIDAYRIRQQERHRDGYKPDVRELRHRLDAIRERAKHEGRPFDLKAAQAQVKQQSREAYENGLKTNWSDPNSTDIHAIEKVENLTAYVVKYVTKTDGADEVTGVNKEAETETVTTRTRKIVGRIWGCSDGIRNLKHFDEEIATEAEFHTMTHDNAAFEFVRHLEREAYEKKQQNPDDETVWKDEDSGTLVYRLDKKAHLLLKVLFPHLFAQYAHHYAKQYAEVYSKKIPTLKKLETVNNILENRYSFTLSDKIPDDKRYVENSLLESDWFDPVSDCPF